MINGRQVCQRSYDHLFYTRVSHGFMVTYCRTTYVALCLEPDTVSYLFIFLSGSMKCYPLPSLIFLTAPVRLTDFKNRARG